MDIKTEEDALIAVTQGNYCTALSYVPWGLKTLKVCFAAVRRHGMALRFVPKRMKTFEVCFAAVKCNSTAICYLPVEYRCRMNGGDSTYLDRLIVCYLEDGELDNRLEEYLIHDCKMVREAAKKRLKKVQP